LRLSLRRRSIAAELPLSALRAVGHDLLVGIDLVTDAHDVGPPADGVHGRSAAFDAVESLGMTEEDLAQKPRPRSRSTVTDEEALALDRRHWMAFMKTLPEREKARLRRLRKNRMQAQYRDSLDEEGKERRRRSSVRAGTGTTPTPSRRRRRRRRSDRDIACDGSDHSTCCPSSTFSRQIVSPGFLTSRRPRS
jgi:hypothetical protein